MRMARKEGAKSLAWKVGEYSSKRGFGGLYFKPIRQVKAICKLQMFRERALRRGRTGGTAEASRLWVELLHFSACQFTCRAKLVSSLLLPPLAAEALSHLVAQF